MVLSHLPHLNDLARGCDIIWYVGRVRSRERIRACVRASVAVLQRQVTSASPGWPEVAGNHPAPEVTALVLRVPAELWTDGGAATRRAIQSIRSVLRSSPEAVGLARRAGCAAALLHADPTDVDGQVIRAQLLASADEALLDPPDFDALAQVLGSGAATRDIDQRRQSWNWPALEADCDLPQLAADLLTRALAGFVHLDDDVQKGLHRLAAEVDPIHRAWVVGGRPDAALSAVALRALAEWRDPLEPDLDWLVGIAEGLCSLALPGGGWGTRGKLQLDDRVDNIITCHSVIALDRVLRLSATVVDELTRPDRVVDLLYEVQDQARLDWIPPVRSVDHTMYAAVDPYSGQKLPRQAIEQLIIAGGRIEVHGVYPTHVRSLMEDRTLTSVMLLTEQTKNQLEMATTKRFNTVRPHFYSATDASGQPVILVGVGAGEDYLMHYATMIRHTVLTTSAMVSDNFLTVYRYPEAETDIAYWTGLDDHFVQPGDRVVIGYVEECQSRLDSAPPVDSTENDFYGSNVYHDRSGRRVTFLGVKYSFWGSISYFLAERLCELGCSEIVYCGKLGALTGDDDLYRRIFVPTKFAKLRHDQVEYVVEPVPPNGVVDAGLAAGTGMHISIPTVLEENYNQRATAERLHAQSIDNEISQIAQAVSLHNQAHPASSPVGFAAVHFATDYIRSEDERNTETSHDLSTTRSREAKAGRSRMLETIVRDVLEPYLALR